VAVAYFIAHFDDETWAEARRDGFTASGYPPTLRNRGRIGEGDILLCYRTGVGEFIGALEVTGSIYEVGPEGPRIWRRELFPLRFPVRLIARVELDSGVRREEVRAQSETPASWTAGIIRNAGNSIPESDGNWILEQLREKKQLTAAEEDPDLLRDDLITILDGVSKAKSEPFKGHPLANLIRERWPRDLKRSAWPSVYKAEGSPGKSRWAEVVWAAIYNRLITESATSGYYTCIGISPGGEKAILALMLGTTEVLTQYKSAQYEDVLRANAELDLSLLANENLDGLHKGPIDYGGEGNLARGYSAGTIIAVEYSRKDLPPVEAIRGDLERMLHLYDSLHRAKAETDEGAGGDIPLPTGSAPPKTKEERTKVRREKRRLRIHLQAERNRSLSSEAKRLRGEKCEVLACGKVPTERYGDIAENLLEAHHIVPFAQLDDNVELDPGRDFRVVCPDCHRALHKRSPDPYTLEELSAAIEGQRGTGKIE
jgi:5-methylcytosine-specific restriction enzyme A